VRQFLVAFCRRYYQAKIFFNCFIGVNSDETVDVTYVDFGNSEKLPFSDIRKLPDMFLRLAKQVICHYCSEIVTFQLKKVLSLPFLPQCE